MSDDKYNPYQSITMKDFDDDFINDVILIDGEERKFVTEHDASDYGFNCPVCDADPSIGNKILQMDDGRYLYIALCCGEFAICEVTGEDNGVATE